MSSLEFFEPCIPPKSTAQTKRVSRSGHYFPSKQHAAAKATYDAILMPHRPGVVLNGELSITVEMTWPWRSGDSKALRSRGRVPHTSRPDLDNIIKGLIDRMVALQLIEDDACVWSLTVRKWWGDKPGILVRVHGESPWSPKAQREG